MMPAIIFFNSQLRAYTNTLKASASRCSTIVPGTHPTAMKLHNKLGLTPGQSTGQQAR